MKLCPRTLLIIVLIAMLVGTGDPEAATLPQTPTTLPSCPVILFEAVSPFFDQDQTLFASTRDGILWCSTDDDATWQAVYQVPTDTNDYFVSSLLIAPVVSEDGLHLYLVVRKDGSIISAYYRTYSPDGGATWEALWSDAMAGCWVTATNEEGTLFASCMTLDPVWGVPDGIHRSTDHGHTWQPVWMETAGWEPVAPSPDFANDRMVYAIRDALWPDPGLYPMVSTDGGLSWQDIAPGLCPEDSNTNIRKIVVSPNFPADQTLFGLAYSHLLKSEDGGASWQHLYPEDEDPCQDYPLDSVWQVALSPDYASDRTVFMRTDSGLHVSYDDGRHWRQSLEDGQISGDILVRRRPAVSYRSLYLPLLLRGAETNSAILHRIFLPLMAGSGVLPHPTPLTLFAKKRGEYAYVRSDDGGVTWRCVNPPP